MREDQTSVNEWAINTFGDCTLEAAVRRMDKEYSELVLKAGCANVGDYGDELADVLICMYRVAQKAGVDLQAHVDMKMTINRRRKWKMSGDGTGQHISE